MRLKAKDIKPTRDTLLSNQTNCCALCGEDCSADPVLDHDHKTGALRAVLHRQCNAFLGRMENNAARHGVQRNELPQFLQQAAAYLQQHSSDQTGLLHPTHRTAEEKAARAKKRAKAARDRRKAALLEDK